MTGLMAGWPMYRDAGCVPLIAQHASSVARGAAARASSELHYAAISDPCLTFLSIPHGLLHRLNFITSAVQTHKTTCSEKNLLGVITLLHLGPDITGRIKMLKAR